MEKFLCLYRTHDRKEVIPLCGFRVWVFLVSLWLIKRLDSR